MHKYLRRGAVSESWGSYMLTNPTTVHMNSKFTTSLEEGKLGLPLLDYLVIREVRLFDRICFGD